MVKETVTKNAAANMFIHSMNGVVHFDYHMPSASFDCAVWKKIFSANIDYVRHHAFPNQNNGRSDTIGGNVVDNRDLSFLARSEKRHVYIIPKPL